MLRSRLPAVAFLSLLPACGGTLKEQKHTQMIQQLRVDDAFADDYFVDDLDCQTGSGVDAIGPSQIYQWQGDATRPTSFPFAATSGVETLHSAAITSSLFGFHQSQVCQDGETPTTCSGTPAVVTAQKPLKICKNNAKYPRVSVEGVALTSLANIGTAESFYHTIPGASGAILPSYLLVLPIVEKVVNDANGEPLKRAVTTDNLAYSANFGGSPVFVVYPKGKKAAQAGLWKDLNLWELPWGLAHEFGHHVFRTHTGIVKLTDSSAAAFAPIRSTRQDFDGSGGGLSLAGAPRNVTGTSVFDAVNEGYADLYAYYVFDSQAGLTKNVSCFEMSRDVASAQFKDGRAKVLDPDVLAVFFATTEQGVPNCEAADFQDIHAVGAVVAYGMDRLFDLRATGAGSVRAQQKAAMLLSWATRIGTAIQGKAPADLTFDVLVKQGLIAMAPDKKLTKAECAVVKTQFPVYAGTWLASEFSCN